MARGKGPFSTLGALRRQPGTLAESYHFSGDQQRTLKKEVFTAQSGDLLRAVLPGAGGWGPPYERDADKVLADVRNKKVSVTAAWHDYGVAIDEETLRVDIETTKALRQKMRPDGVD